LKNIVPSPKGSGGNTSYDQWNFFMKEIGTMFSLCPFHLVDAKFAEGLFVKEGKNEKADCNN